MKQKIKEKKTSKGSILTSSHFSLPIYPNNNCGGKKGKKIIIEVEQDSCQRCQPPVFEVRSGAASSSYRPRALLQAAMFFVFFVFDFVFYYTSYFLPLLLSIKAE